MNCQHSLSIENTSPVLHKNFKFKKFYVNAFYKFLRRLVNQCVVLLTTLVHFSQSLSSLESKPCVYLFLILLCHLLLCQATASLCSLKDTSRLKLCCPVSLTDVDSLLALLLPMQVGFSFSSRDFSKPDQAYLASNVACGVYFIRWDSQPYSTII